MGEHQFVLRDLAEESADLYVQDFSDGKTFQDYLDYQGEPGECFYDPTWATRVIKRGIEWNESIDGKVYTFLLNEEGEHVIVIVGKFPVSVWICAPLWVIEAPSD